jgi:hypothetical protein
MYTFEDFIKKSIPEEFIKDVCFQTVGDNIHVGHLCITCTRNISVGKIPKYNLRKNEELSFPSVDAHIKNLFPDLLCVGFILLLLRRARTNTECNLKEPTHFLLTW